MGSLYLGITSFRKSQYKGDVEYYRDLPYMSPAAAARMNDVMSASSSILGSGKIKKGDKLVNRQMSSTVMSLASKGAIAIYPGPAKLYDGIDLTTTNAASVAGRLGSDAATARKMKKTSTIVIMPVARNDIGSLLLSSSEHAALDILLKASSRLRDTQVFDLKQMNKAFKHYKKGYKLLQDFDTACSTEFDNLRAVDSSRGFLNNLVGILGLVFAFYKGVQYAERGEIAVTMSICVPVVLACAFALVYGKYHALTDNGQKYGGQVAGLKRYLLDFSDFSDRGVLDMTLWGRYMVYATAFGISDKVMAQLTKAYPEVPILSGWMSMPLRRTCTCRCIPAALWARPLALRWVQVLPPRRCSVRIMAISARSSAPVSPTCATRFPWRHRPPVARVSVAVVPAVPSPVAVSTAVAVVPAVVRSEDADMCDTHIRVAHGIRRKKG